MRAHSLRIAISVWPSVYSTPGASIANMMSEFESTESERIKLLFSAESESMRGELTRTQSSRGSTALIITSEWVATINCEC